VAFVFHSTTNTASLCSKKRGKKIKQNTPQAYKKKGQKKYKWLSLALVRVLTQQ
jgi:hypothetical protein